MAFESVDNTRGTGVISAGLIHCSAEIAVGDAVCANALFSPNSIVKRPAYINVTTNFMNALDNIR